MAGLKGQTRLPQQDARTRRNAAKLAGDAKSVFGGALTVGGDGIVVLSLAANGGLNQTLGLSVNLEASNPSLQLLANELGVFIDADGGLQKVAHGLAVKVEASKGLALTSSGIKTVVVSPLALGTSGISLAGLTGFGTADQIIGMHNGTTAWEYKAMTVTAAGVVNCGSVTSSSFGKFTQVQTPEIKTDISAPADLLITTGAAKTLKLATPVYNDIQQALIVRTTGAGRPTLATVVAPIQQYQFGIGNNAEVEGSEFLHGWVEGTPIELHVHWITGGLNDNTPRGVKWQVDYTWANMEAAGGTVVFAPAATLYAAGTIAANEADRTHKYSSCGTFTPTGGKIGAYLLCHVTRVAATAAPTTAPDVDPFGIALGIHYQIDTQGSRNLGSK